MAPFSYGEAFLDINLSLLKRYAACEDEEQVKKAEQVWLDKLEREYAESRVNALDNENDAWKGGNLNRRAVVDSDSEDAGALSKRRDSNERTGVISHGGQTDGDEHGENEEEEEVQEQGDKDPFDISDDTEDEAEMEEIRRKVLKSKPFANHAEAALDLGSKSKLERVAWPTAKLESSARPGSEHGDDDDADFDNIFNATLVTDRSGIQARQRSKEQDKISAAYSKKVLNA